MSGPVETFDAVVLAGGRGSRLGGVDKPALRVGERSLLGSVVGAAAGAGARLVVVVGPERRELAAELGELRVVREEPPGGGPVPAVRTGLAEVGAPWVAVLAADLPFLRSGQLVSLLAAAREADAAGAVLADDTGHLQWLVGCWRTVVLREAAGNYQGGSLHGLLWPLRPVVLAPAHDRGGPPPWLDCDTADDVRLARTWSNVPAGSEGRKPR
ncbi:MAG TPA: NTP transferase domain-containing protein [Streptosporangiaceae bacterium]